MNASIIHRVKLALAAIVLVLFFTKFVKADEQTYSRVLRGTVLVVNGDGLGSGVLVDGNRKLVVTAGHVVGDSADVTVCFPDFQANGRPNTSQSHYLTSLKKLGIHAHVLKSDPTRDVAVLQLDRLPSDALEVPMATAPVMPGQTVFAIGNSGADDDDFMWCYRDGGVRQVCHKHLVTGGRRIDAEMIETTIASNHGDSGGPIVNARGELIAITVTHHADRSPEDIGQNIGYCTEVSEIRALLDSLNVTTTTTPNLLTISPLINATQSNNAGVTFTGLAAEIDAVRGLPLLNGVNVNVRLSITGYAHHDCDLIATLADSHGNVVLDASGKAIQSSMILAPTYDETNYYNDPARHLTLRFMQPQIQSAMHGATTYSFLISVRDKATGQWITTAPAKVDFTEPAN